MTPFAAPSLSKLSPSTRCSVTTSPTMSACDEKSSHVPPCSLKYDVGLEPVGRIMRTSACVTPGGNATENPRTPTGRLAPAGGGGEDGTPVFVTPVMA